MFYTLAAILLIERTALFCGGTRELTDLSSEANQQTGTRELPTDLRSETHQKTGTRELTTDLISEAHQQIGTRVTNRSYIRG